MSWQRVDGPQHAFLFSPQLVQQGNFGSDLVRLGDGHGGMKGWAKTRAAALANKRVTPTAASKKLLGRRGRGCKPIPRRVRRMTLLEQGRRGGLKHSGHGSSAADVPKKELWSRKRFAEDGYWPSLREARKERKIYRTIYNRVVGNV